MRPALRQQVSARGDDPERLPHVYAHMINAIADIPADMTISMPSRGNFRSTSWRRRLRAGGGNLVQHHQGRRLLHGIRLSAPAASSRCGSPTGKTVRPASSPPRPAPESRDELRRRIDAAAKFIDIDQLYLSPQCGFASTEEGNLLAEEEQWAKLRMIVDLAQEVWG